MSTCSSPRSARTAPLASSRRSLRAMRIISPRRTGTSMRYGRNPTTPRLYIPGRSCFSACATSSGTRYVPGSQLRRGTGRGRVTGATRSGTTTRSSLRIRTTVRWGAHPMTAARRTRLCSRNRRNGRGSLFELDPGGADDFRPQLVVVADERSELLGAAPGSDAALGEQALLHLRRGEDRRSVALDSGDERCRHAGGPEQRVPEVDLVAF